MTRVLYIPTGIVFEVPDIAYFETLFTTDPTLKISENILQIAQLVNLIAGVDPNFFPNNASSYVSAVKIIQNLGRECFEVL
jgi:hypothetical protein